MWFSLARLALKTGSEVYKNRKETRVLESIAEKRQMQRVIDGEIEMVAKLLNRSIKDKLEAEANDLNMMKKQVSKLPL